MEAALFDISILPEYIIHWEILENIEDTWLEGLTFRDAFIYQMPVTKNLLEHLRVYCDTSPPKWMILAFPVLKAFFKTLNPMIILDLDLKDIILMEANLNPKCLPYPKKMFIDQVFEAKKEIEGIDFISSTEVLYTCIESCASPSLSIVMSEAFPFEKPLIQGSYLDAWNFKWIVNKTTLKTLFKRYQSFILTLEPAFSYIASLCSPQSRVQLCHPITGEVLPMDQMHLLRLEIGTYLVIHCKVLSSDYRIPEFHAKIWIDIRKFDEFPSKIETHPKNLITNIDASLWDKDASLGDNIFNCLMGDEKMEE